MGRKPRIPTLLLFFLPLLVAAAFGPRADRGGLVKLFPGESNKVQTFDLKTRDGLHDLVIAVEALIELSERQQKEWKQARERMLGVQPIAEMSQAELKKYFHEPDDILTKRDRRGLKEIHQLAELLQETQTPGERERLAGLIEEISLAIQNNGRAPVPESLDFVEVPWMFWEQWRHPVACGRTPAGNLLRATGKKDKDLSRYDPEPSTFWRRPASVPDQDLYRGFGRTGLPGFEREICEYLAPKTSYGANPGLEVKCGRHEIKVKFAETTSEPLAARILCALGYHVDPTDYAPQLRIRYDRRFLREFHLRKEIQTRFHFFGFIPVHTIQLQRRHDPFDYVAEGVLKDGARISGTELKRRLFRDPDVECPEDLPWNFKTELESEIDHLVTVPVNVQVKEASVDSIGPWDFGQLGHEDLRELRGLALLAAWLGWYDSRFENTRLKIVEANGRSELLHFLSDVGGGLGRGAGFYSGQGELPNEFEWTFTKAPVLRGKGSMTTPFRIIGFKPIADTPAFKAMTLDDARWMARLIAQLTERQIVEALVASGFDSAQVRLYTEKLLSRRDQMIRDLGLEDEVAPLRPEGVDRKLTYDPGLNGPVRIETADRREVLARAGQSIVREGRIVFVPSAPSSKMPVSRREIGARDGAGDGAPETISRSRAGKR
jgi:hypothetical protein